MRFSPVFCCLRVKVGELTLCPQEGLNELAYIYIYIYTCEEPGDANDAYLNLGIYIYMYILQVAAAAGEHIYIDIYTWANCASHCLCYYLSIYKYM